MSSTQSGYYYRNHEREAFDARNRHRRNEASRAIELANNPAAAAERIAELEEELAKLQATCNKQEAIIKSLSEVCNAVLALADAMRISHRGNPRRAISSIGNWVKMRYR